VISGFDADQFLGVGESVDERFEFSGGTELIARAADEEFGLGAFAQEFEIVGAVFIAVWDGDGGQAESDERAYTVVGIGGTQSDGGAERKTGEDDGQRELAFEPVEGGAHVFDFADAACVLAFAQFGAAEVETEHGESEAVERFHGVEDDFVVQRSTVERMRMAHHGGVRRVGRSGVEESFQASGGAGEEQGADAGSFGEHRQSLVVGRWSLVLQRICPPATSDQRPATVTLSCMDLFALTRRLIDIESTTPNESAVGDFLCDELRRRGLEARKMPVEGARANVLAGWPGHARPEIVFSTHMDTVPPFIASSEDDACIYGRGACDAKGTIAAQILAAEKLRGAGVFAGLLFLVGEERDSIGAKVANQQPTGARFMINGEPTENKLALASKGALHVELAARGKMAHSAYPELGESAIDKLVEALHRLHAMKLPEDAEVGPCTKNVGSIRGGRAPNVIPDFAKADLFYRLVGPSETLRREITEAVGELAEVRFTRETPFLRLRTLDGLPTMVAAFTTDIPSLTNWGEPLLLGPGSIHVAHTNGEFVEKAQLREAVEIYCSMAKRLMLLPR
jgi:acetylornithine deacetylase